VHKNSIAVAVLPPASEKITETCVIENTGANIAKLVRRLTVRGPAEFVYEAGPCGYELQRMIAQLGHRCAVIAPGLIPVKPTDRVKTNRRDAEKLARLQRAGELTEIRIPELHEEAARDLTRVREDCLTDRLRARHRLSKFLLRHGRVFRETKSWSSAHRAWLSAQRFDWPAQQQTYEAYVRTLAEVEARLETLNCQIEDLAQTAAYRSPVSYLRCFKGIETLTALTLIAEAQDFRRFASAAAFMSFTGLVCSEWSTGDHTNRGSITKAGNAHLRRVLGEAAWSYQHKTALSQTLLKRRQGCPADVLAIARKADTRLHRKYARLVARGKPHQVAVVAVARELAGFIWAMASHFPVH
jgi:transposase